MTSQRTTFNPARLAPFSARKTSSAEKFASLRATGCTFRLAGPRFALHYPNKVGKIHGADNKNPNTVWIPWEFHVILPLQSKLARTALGLGVREVGFLADLNSETVNRLEKDDSVKPVTIARVAAVYRFVGIIFIDDERKPGILLDTERLRGARSDALDEEFNQHFSTEAKRYILLGSFLRSLSDRDGGWNSGDYVRRVGGARTQGRYHRNIRPVPKDADS